MDIEERFMNFGSVLCGRSKRYIHLSEYGI